MKRHEHSMQRATPPGDGPPVSIEDAVNLAMDLEAAGDTEHARAVLREAAARFPEALARVTSLRAATNELRAPVAHADLTSRVLAQWEREELLESGPLEIAPQRAGMETGPLELAPVPQDWPTPRAAVAASSQPRHRRARGRGKVGGRWTMLAACVFGVAISIGLYVTNQRGASPATGPTGGHAPHLLAGAAPVVTQPTAPAPGTPLRLGNAGSYDHVPMNTTLTARAARLRYDAQPAEGWVFAGLQPAASGQAAEPQRPVLIPFAGLFADEGGGDEAARGPLDPSLAKVRLRLGPPAAADE